MSTDKKGVFKKWDCTYTLTREIEGERKSSSINRDRSS